VRGERDKPLILLLPKRSIQLLLWKEWR